MQFGVVADNRKLTGQSHNSEQQSQPVRPPDEIELVLNSERDH